MRQFLIVLIIFILIVVILIPLLVVRGCSIISPGDGRSDSKVVRVFNEEASETYDLELEEYISGVVAAEMPASFHIEALKAQAVAARTYLVRQLLVKQSRGEEKVVSTDFRSGQAWLSRSRLRQKWGVIGFFPNWYKIQRAVEETEGLILTYNGEPVSAVFHANSGGKTEDARYVWGDEYPYLQSLPSPFDRVDPRYRQNIIWPGNRLAGVLGINEEKIMIEVTARSPSGRVLQVKINDLVLSGQEIREKLKLPSTRFTIKAEEGRVIFEVWGRGHGVGLSQYGANGMAQKGYTFNQILKYYYPGTRLERLDDWLKREQNPVF